MDLLVLRFEAPLMSFGSVVVDQHNKTDWFPYRAMLTGLFANALGLTRAEDQAHEALQSRMRYAARRDKSGEALVDYQTVDFGERGSIGSVGWTTRRAVEERKGGEASSGTHIRFRHYIADAVVTVVCAFDAGAGSTFGALAEAVRMPARPLFLGRKCCVPSVPIYVGTVTAASLRAGLEEVPRAPRAEAGKLPAIWPRTAEDEALGHASRPRVEDRDWKNAIHVGRRLYVEGAVDPPRVGEAE